jgi:hypothetical protein
MNLRKMKKFLLSILVVLLGVFVVDRVGGICMWVVNQNTDDVSGPKIRFLANDINNTDILLMGASRCNLHYVPSIMIDTLGCSVYNGGVDGSDCIISHYILLNLVLEHYTPKVICLEVMTNDFSSKDKSTAFETTSFFAPYFGRNPQVDSVYMDSGYYYRYKLSHLYRFNAKAMSNIAGLFVSRQSESDRGYIPTPKPALFPSQIDTSAVPECSDPIKLKYLYKYINLCKKHNIKLIFVVSPMYTYAPKNLYAPIKRIAKENGIAFFDYHTPGTFLRHPEYFRDKYHLWDIGSRKFSKIFAHDLKDYLKSEI